VGHALREPGCVRGGAHQAAGEAAEDLAEIGGLEPFGDQDRLRLGGLLAHWGGEHRPVADEPADEADDAADAAGRGGDGVLMRIGLVVGAPVAAGAANTVVPGRPDWDRARE
jgi:hypothetical protein